MTTNLPKGTVTFLFTDIEGSTKLLNALAEGYASVLADQRDILRSSFERWNGREVDTQGDAFFVAFSRASDGVAAAAEIQQALNAHSWPGGVEVLVRMGLHTGEPVVAREGYIGMDVHRAARIAHVGHGGQVLLSESVVALVRDQTPEGVNLKELGEHQLKDLSRPEPIYQLVIPGLPSEFPLLNSLDARPNNLPIQQTSFVGRQAEIGEVKSLLEKERLVTILGPGGIGKTRLSLQVAAGLVDQFPHGVWFLELASVPDPKQIASLVADELNFNIDVHSSDLEPRRQLLDFLSTRSLLLILDNFEHLVEGADILADFLQEAPQVKLLVTSRERLNLRQEWVYSMQGLEISSNGSEKGVPGESAIVLFQERARQGQSGYKLGGAEKSEATRICQILDGMPLGIELAAAWTSMLSCKEIADEIQKNLDFLSSPMRGVPEKHRSLRAVFEYSWQLLKPDEQMGFRKLALFRGGFSHQAAEKVAAVRLSLLSEFMHKSLLRRNYQGRFEIHEVFRQYAEEALRANPEELELTLERHSRYFYERLGELIEALKGEDPADASQEMRSNQGNLHTATFWILDHWSAGEARTLFARLQTQYFTLGWHEGVDAFRKISEYLKSGDIAPETGTPYNDLLLSALAYQTSFMSDLGAPDTEEICLRILPKLRESDLQLELGICLRSVGICAVYRGAYREAVEYIKESLSLIHGKDHVFGVISCLLWLGWAYSELGEFDQAYMYYSESYEIAMDSREGAGLAYTLSKLGTLADIRGAYAEGLKYHQQALETFRAIEDQAGQGYALSRMSVSAWGLGDYERSVQYAHEGYTCFFDIGHRWGISTSLGRIGFAEVGLGKLDDARGHFLEAVERSLSYNYRFITAYALIGLAFIGAREGNEIAAVELIAVALTYPSLPAHYKMIAQMELETVRERMTKKAFEAAWNRGETADFEDVVNRVQAGEFALQS